MSVMRDDYEVWEWRDSVLEELRAIRTLLEAAKPAAVLPKYPCRYCGTLNHLEGSPAEDLCRDRIVRSLLREPPTPPAPPREPAQDKWHGIAAAHYGNFGAVPGPVWVERLAAALRHFDAEARADERERVLDKLSDWLSRHALSSIIGERARDYVETLRRGKS